MNPYLIGPRYWEPDTREQDREEARRNRIEAEVARRMCDPAALAALHDYVDIVPTLAQLMTALAERGLSAEDRRAMMVAAMGDVIDTYETAMAEQIEREEA